MTQDNVLFVRIVTRQSGLGTLPQGAVLSPILFTIYKSDLPRTPYVQLAMFADYTAIFSQSWRPDTIARRLSYNLTRLTSYFEIWRLKENTKKNASYSIYQTTSCKTTLPQDRTNNNPMVNRGEVPRATTYADSKLYYTYQRADWKGAGDNAETVPAPWQRIKHGNIN
jgi:hypothetical protein